MKELKSGVTDAERQSFSEQKDLTGLPITTGTSRTTLAKLYQKNTGFLATNMQDNFHSDAFEGLMRGIQKGANAVRPTLGAAGTNVIIEHEMYPGKIITNDANSIIQAMELADPLEKIGLSFLKESAEQQTKAGGDGRTTMILLLAKILEEGFKSGLKGLQLKKELDDLLPLIEKSLDEQKHEITIEDIAAVAEIAGESRELGETLREIYRVIGKEGIIHLEGSGTYSTSYSLVEGVRFSGTGYLSPYMVHDEQAVKDGRKENKAVYENPTILVTKRRISHLNDINPLLQTLTKNGKKDLVIFTDDMDSGVASIMVEAHKSHVMNILIIKAPVLFKTYVFEDFAKITGATIVEDSSGINFKNLELSHLGTCGKIVVDKDETTVIGIVDIADHITELKAQGDTDSKLRLSWLQTKTAILRLGANSESELSYLRLKAEDAIHASRLALQDGVVAGGGVALMTAIYILPDTIAGQIMSKALSAPFKQIITNAGVDIETIDRSGYSNTVGFDTKTGKLVDMFEAGIIDAAIVTKTAVRIAIGIASTILTSASLITLPEKTPEQLAHEMLQAKGLRM